MKHIIHIILPLLFSGLAATAYYQQWFSALDLYLFDVTQAQQKTTTDSDVLIIAIDEQSLEHIGRWPWPRNIHTQILERLTQANAKAVVFDVLFGDPDKNDLKNDAIFAKAIKKNGTVFLPLYFEKLTDRGQLIEVPPTPILYQAAKAIGHAHIDCEEDGICRSVYLKEGLGSPYWPHISLAVFMEEADQEIVIPGERFDFMPPYSPMLLYRDYHNYISFSEHYQLPTISYYDVLEGNIPDSIISNKVIFIGATAVGLKDTLTTPKGQVAGVYIEANIYQQLKNNTLIQKTSTVKTTVIVGILVFLILAYISYLPPSLFLLSTAAAVIGILVTQYSLLKQAYLWFPSATVILFIMIFYPLWSWLRLEIALRFLKKNLALASDIAPQEHSIKKHLFSSSSSINEIVSGADTISRTIAQLVNINQELEANRQLLQQTMNKFEGAFLIFNKSGEIISSNINAKKLYPHTSNIYDLNEHLAFNTNHEWTDILNNLFTKGDSFHYEATYLKSASEEPSYHQNPPDTIVYVQAQRVTVSRKSLTDKEVKHSANIGVITITDISELKKVEQSRLETLNFISHDLRSPMISNLALIKNARRNMSLSEDFNTLLSNIEKYSNRNLEYAESLLQLSRAENLNPQNYQLCDFHAIVDDAYTDVIEIAKDKNIKIILQRDDNDAWTNGEPDLLRRALINLLTNAIKYSPEYSQVNLILSNEHLIKTENNSKPWIKISVADQGIGIAQEKIPHLFKRFNRLNNGTESGAGLGLYFVNTVIQRHGGKINIASKPESGSRFDIYLPCIHIAEFE